MRQKLEKKKDTVRGDGLLGPGSEGSSDQPSVEKLVEFIEGAPHEKEVKVSAKAAKRQRRKKKKVCM